MNKREQKELMNIVVPPDNLFFFAENMEENLLKDIDTEAYAEFKTLKKNIEEYKKKLLENLNVIEETKDFLEGIVNLKVSNERIASLISLKNN